MNEFFELLEVFLEYVITIDVLYLITPKLSQQPIKKKLSNSIGQMSARKALRN